ncbi:MAG: sensor histidine kinase [Spirochaetaceae bacterium]|nr:MAG: sensor histidine kinase [Spirochaetaceae bacterium]
MKPGIARHLVFSHLLMVALAIGVFVLVLVTVTDRQAAAAGLRADQATATQLAPWIERFYRERGSWLGFSRAFDDSRLALRPPMMMPRGAMVRRGPSAEHELRVLLEQPIIVFSRAGDVVVARGVTDRIVETRRTELSRAVVIGDSGNPVGYLFLGAMANPDSNPLRVLIARTTRAAAGATSVVVLIAAALASVLWTRRLVRPLRSLTAAAASMARGEYGTRVVVPVRRDEIADLAGSFNEMATEIEAQETSRKRFVADAAHELRTPLSLVATRVEMLESGLYSPTSDQWQALRSGVGRMQRLVDDLQILARIEARRVTLRIEPIDTHDAIAQVISAFEPAATLRKIGLIVITDHSDNSTNKRPAVLADRERLHQVLSNLVDNAIRYSAEGGTVRLGAEPGEREGEHGFTPMTIWIEDDGPGIPVSERKRVFERFVRLDEARDRSSGGSGLGLAIVSELLQLQNGSIRVEDAMTGTGARFSVSLPRA